MLLAPTGSSFVQLHCSSLFKSAKPLPSVHRSATDHSGTHHRPLTRHRPLPTTYLKKYPTIDQMNHPPPILRTTDHRPIAVKKPTTGHRPPTRLQSLSQRAPACSFKIEIRPISPFRLRAFGAPCTMTKMVCNLVVTFFAYCCIYPAVSLWRVRDNFGQPRELGRENPSKLFEGENQNLAGGDQLFYS